MANSGRVVERGLDGVAFDAATPASQPGDVFPSGIIMAYAGAAAPTNWLLCDGSLVSRATYPGLFAAIGTTFGAGDGSTTFGLPDLRGKMPVGKHSAGTFVTMGTTGGEEQHQLTVSEMPQHNHGGSVSAVGDHTHWTITTNTPTILRADNTGSVFGFGGSGTPAIYQSSSNATNATGAHSHTISNQGNNGNHNNMPPYMVLNFIIKAN